MRSKVAASRRLAIRLPRSIRLAVVALPQEALLADEADAAAESRQRLLLELLDRALRVGGALLVDLHVQIVVALEELAHDDLRADAGLPVGSRRSVRKRSRGRPARSSSATTGSGLSNVASTMRSTSSPASWASDLTGKPRNCPPPAALKTPTGSRSNSRSVR